MKNECASNDDLQILSVDDMRKIDGGKTVVYTSPDGTRIVINV